MAIRPREGEQADPDARPASPDETRKRRRDHRERGAVLAEFAFTAPILFLVVFAIIDFGWAFAQHIDTRHAAREASRLAAVNYGEDLGNSCGFPAPGPCSGTNQTREIVKETCERLNFVKAKNARVRIDFVNDTDPDGRQQGEFVVVEVQADLEQITGFLGFALDGTTLSSEAETRIEHGVGIGTDQAVTFDETGPAQPAFISCPA